MLGQYCPLSLFSQTRTVLQKKKHNTRIKKNKKVIINENMVMTNAQDLLQNYVAERENKHVNSYSKLLHQSQINLCKVMR